MTESKSLELHIANTNVQNSVVPIHWCVDSETLSWLKENSATEPHILIIVCPEDKIGYRSYEYKKVVPLSDMMTYIDFHSSGKNIICGIILFNRNKKELKNIERSDGCARLYSCKPGEIEIESYVTNSYHINKAPVTDIIKVEIPEGIFAKEPPEWEKAWVNWLCIDNIHNECDYRRRRIFAYSVQPFIALFLILLRLFIATLCFSCGFILNKSLKFANIISCDFDYFIMGGFWWLKLPGISWDDSKFGWLNLLLILLFSPLIIISNIIISTYGGFSIWHIPIILFIVCALSISAFLIRIVSGSLMKKKVSHKPKQNIKKIKVWQSKLNKLTCEKDRQITSVKDLPKEYRTFKLYVEDIKSRWCKPFSR